MKIQFMNPWVNDNTQLAKEKIWLIDLIDGSKLQRTTTVVCPDKFKMKETRYTWPAMKQFGNTESKYIKPKSTIQAFKQSQNKTKIEQML